MTDKQKKQAIAIVVALVLLVAALFGLKFYNKKTEEKQTAADEAARVYVNQTTSDAITALSWEYNGETSHLTKTDDTWTCTEQPDLTLDTDQVTTLLDAVASLEATQQVENPEDDATYGLEAPTNVITYTTSDGTTTLTLGNENNITGGNYLKNSDNDNIYLVDTTLVTTFDCDVSTLEKTEESETSETAETSSSVSGTSETAEDSSVVNETSETPETSSVVNETSETPETSSSVTETSETVEDSSIVNESSATTTN